MITKVLTQEKIIEVFGDFHPYLNEEGHISQGWPDSILSAINLPSPLPLSWNKSLTVKRISCHKLITEFLSNALDNIYSQPDIWNTINDYGGCYNFRLQRKDPKTLSHHCWGIAIDLDVGDNPFGRNPQVDRKVVELFREQGFIWGGTFPQKRIDGMHFEFADLSKL